MMATVIEQKLDQIILDLDLIKNSLKIVPDRESIIKDKKSSVSDYETFAKDELKLNAGTITNPLSIISKFLVHSDGIITKDSVKSYLESNGSDSWKSNQIKALRKYIRDFLKLGSWINDFEFSKTKAKIKHLPTDEELLEFAKQLKDQTQLAFLLLHNSGLRIEEIMKLKIENINFQINSIDASEIHDGQTKHSWVSFFTSQTAEFLQKFISHHNLDSDDMLFSVNPRTIQNNFKLVSEQTGITLTPHILRSVFTEKCTMAKIPDKYIDALCGRTSPGMIAKHYTDYSPEKLRLQYNLVESLLVMG